MMEPAEMLEARLALVEVLRPLERAVARDAFTRAAVDLLRGRSHELGNHLQIVRLASLEIERRCTAADAVELLNDLRSSAGAATAVLATLLEAARPAERSEPGPPVAAIVRAAAERVRALFPEGITFVSDAPEDLRSLCREDELHGIVIAAALGSAASALRLELHARTIEKRPWLQLLCHGPRRAGYDDLIESLAALGAGEVTLSAGREGDELAIELPVASRTS